MLSVVCLSDLHLGSPDGLLDQPLGAGDAPQQPAPTLVELANALRATIASLKLAKPPKLVLLGDILDLGLASFGRAGDTFVQFLSALFPEGQAALFDPDITYIPGNHDHHIWRQAQDAQYVAAVIGTKRGSSLPHNPDPITPMLGAGNLQSALLTALMKRVPALGGGKCLIRYPNLALRSADGVRSVVFHHGHYIDSMYLTMSALNGWIDGTSKLPATCAAIERQNGAWIDFLWSDLGSSGVIGREASTLYDIMMDGAATHRFAERLSERAAKSLAEIVGMTTTASLDVGAASYGLTIKALMSALVDVTAGRISEGQREAWRNVMSEAETDTLRWYLSGPLAHAFRQELATSAAAPPPPVPPALPRELSFVFGHTHKPFQAQLPVAPYATPVQVFNTGGWEFRGTAPWPCHGGAAVLIDDQLNVVSLRLYNDPIHDTVPPVHVAGTDHQSDSAARFIADMAKAVADNQAPWSQFTQTIGARIKTLEKQNVMEQLPPGVLAPLTTRGAA